MSDAPTALPPPAPRRAPRASRLRRLLAGFTTALPVLVMAALALFSWWLVNQAPVDRTGIEEPPPRHEPDYTMHRFSVQRFAPDGSLRTQIEGDLALHFPDTDTLQIENPRIRSIGVDGRITVATAERALANADGSEVQLLARARVVREATPQDEAIEFESEFLHFFARTERVRSHLPVVVTQGETVVRAAGMAYDNLARVVDLQGRVRAVFAPPRRAQP